MLYNAVRAREPSPNAQRNDIERHEVHARSKAHHLTTSAANSGETLYVHVSKLNENEVLVPGSQAIRFAIDLSGGHANNVLVQNVLRALADRLVVKIESTILEETIG